MTHFFPRSLMLTLLFSATLGLSSLGSAAGTPNPTPLTDAVSVTVQGGDTAYSLARRAGLTVEALLNLNGLSTPDLKVGQVLVLRDNPSHTVQAGETLYAISRKYGVSVEALRSANGLNEDSAIAIGQVLKIAGAPAPVVARKATSVKVAAPATNGVSVAPAPVTTTPPTANEAQAPAPVVSAGLGSNWMENAMALVGTPYVWGGTNQRGTDCSGFVLQVFAPLGVKLPRVSADQARAGIAVDVNNLRPGDLVFFDTVGGGKVTHVGIYLGNDTFANANSYKGQVTVDRLLSDKYWAPRYLGARRVLPDTILASQP